MRILSELVFDDLLLGTGTNYYTSAVHHDQLARADFLGIQACVRGVSFTATLSVQCEHSDDGQNWVNVNGSPEISQPIQNDASYFGSTFAGGLLVQQVQALLRMRISLSGTNGGAQCFLKLYATGRTRAGS